MWLTAGKDRHQQRFEIKAKDQRASIDMKNHLINAFLLCAWKISGKTKEDFGYWYGWYWFLTRSWFRSAIAAVRHKS